MAVELTPCGLYRTTMELEEHSGAVGPGLLVYFHNHSDQGLPIVLLPESNHNNKWRFRTAGHSVTSAEYEASLQSLKAEGFYRLREHFHPDESRIVAANALVQLGYNPKAEPIIFFPRGDGSDNALVFPKQGTRIPASVYDLLEPLDTQGPHKPARVVH